MLRTRPAQLTSIWARTMSLVGGPTAGFALHITLAAA